MLNIVIYIPYKLNHLWFIWSGTYTFAHAFVYQELYSSTTYHSQTNARRPAQARELGHGIQAAAYASEFLLECWCNDISPVRLAAALI
jgi:hypothetical protein